MFFLKSWLNKFLCIQMEGMRKLGTILCAVNFQAVNKLPTIKNCDQTRTQSRKPFEQNEEEHKILERDVKVNKNKAKIHRKLSHRIMTECESIEPKSLHAA